MQRVETVELLPDIFDCNTSDGTVDSSSECLRRKCAENQTIVGSVLFAIHLNSVNESMRADKAHELVDCPDYL